MNIGRSAVGAGFTPARPNFSSAWLAGPAPNGARAGIRPAPTTLGKSPWLGHAMSQYPENPHCGMISPGEYRNESMGPVMVRLHRHGDDRQSSVCLNAVCAADGEGSYTATLAAFRCV